MPALNYQPRFGYLVEKGFKPHTVRSIGKRKIKAGDVLYQFTGMRTAHCHRLCMNLCTNVRRILIGRGGILVFTDPLTFIEPPVDQFALADGFTGWEEMRDWFSDQYGLPFNGQLIQWAPARWESGV